MKQVYIILTKECNLSCDFCIRDYDNNIEYVLNIDKLDLIFSEIENNFPKVNIVLSGGEPTLHDDFHEILSEACKRFKNVTINTNGTTDYFYSKEFFKLDHKHKVTVQISIDGHKALHDSIRGSGNYDKALNTIAKLKGLDKISIVVASTVTNESFLDGFLSLYDDIIIFNPIRWTIKRVSYAGRANSLSYDYLTNDNWNKIVDKIQNIDIDSLIEIFKTFDFNFLDKIPDNLLEKLQDTTVKNCGSGTEKLYVYPNLDVLACTCYESNPSGNLKLDSLFKILNTEQHLNITDQIIDNDVCNTCRYKKLCNGGCLGSGYSTYGEHNIADIKCPKIYHRSC